MIVIQLAGGLGNQMQQYALYRKFVRLGKEARVDISWFDGQRKNRNITGRELELNYFDRLIYEVCLPEEKIRLIGTEGISGKIRRQLFPGSVKWFHESQMYHPEIFGFIDMYLSGYFACEKYYGDILYDLRDHIQFPVSTNPLNRKIMEEMQNSCSVSVHIRRGDYLNAQNREMFGGICTDKYYESAMAFLMNRFENAHFYMFSDDPEYVRSHYQGKQFTIIDWNKGQDSFYDMQLMSCCRHNICANSTFSFWGARLNGNEDKIMIRPAVHKNTQVFEPAKMYELWKNWIFIDKEGHVFSPDMP